MKELFLDANAHVPMTAKSLKAFTDFSNSSAAHGHPMSPSKTGLAAANAMEEARGKIASLVGAKTPDQIVFTSTCTQACEWTSRIVQNVSLKNNYIIVKSQLEHPAIDQASVFLNPFPLYANENAVVNKAIYYEKAAAIICIHLHNEFGTIQPIEYFNFYEYLLSDMSQSLGKIKVDVSELGVDLAVFGAHKFGGPNLGFFYMKNAKDWHEFGSGSRYFLDRPGTPDVASVVATAVALEEALQTLDERSQRMEEFRSILEPGLEEMGFEIIGKSAKRCPNTTFVSMPDGLGLRFMCELGEYGIYTGLGSACGSIYAGASPSIKAIGRDGGPNDYMRISQWGEYGAAEAKILVDTLNKINKGL